VRISVIGCGYLGAVHAAAMASLGHNVVGVDKDPVKVDRLAGGEAPFFEPGLEELLERGAVSGSLEFTTDLGRVAGAKIHFVCVGTPQAASGLGADLAALDGAVDSLIPFLSPGNVVVGKSTAPVGTARRLAGALPAGVALVWNPEFLREGSAVADTLRPDRIVYGVADSGEPRGAAELDSVYGSILEAGVPRLAMSYESAELVKTAANSYLAVRVSFINAVSDLADASGADVLDVAAALRLDPRIGSRFLNPGLGFGGGCLPKDLRALAARADELEAPLTADLLRVADCVNEARIGRVAALAAAGLGGSLDGRRVALLGLAFKPLSDDVRNSPAVRLAAALAGAGARVVATDPVAVGAARPGLEFAVGVREAVAGAELLVLATEWPQYRELDPAEVAGWTAARVIVDARCVLDRAVWAAAGWTVLAPGRPSPDPRRLS
jgi:UDPglucose 6-dehydrogenase